MKKQIILLAISILGAFSLHAQEINEGLVQSKQEVISQPHKGTDWNKQPIGYVFAGAGIGYIPSVEKVEGLAASNYVTGLDWRVGMSRYYNRWGWGVLVQQFRSKQSVAFYDGVRAMAMDDIGRLLYIAPQFTGRWILGEKLTIYGAIGWGWLRYKETVKGSGLGELSGTANALGGNFTVGLEYRLSSVVGMSVDLGLIGGEIGKLKVDNTGLQAAIDETYTGKMDVTRLYATVGAHIYIWKKKR